MSINGQYLWVVELKSFCFDSRTWFPTVGVGLTKAAAIKEKKDWIRRNSGIPPQNFRVTKYVKAT